MRVRSVCNHYHRTYRKEGEEFEHTGPLYEHVEPVEPEPSKKRGKAADKRDGSDEA
jgi:hypothetical protein